MALLRNFLHDILLTEVQKVMVLSYAQFEEVNFIIAEFLILTSLILKELSMNIWNYKQDGNV